MHSSPEFTHTSRNGWIVLTSEPSEQNRPCCLGRRSILCFFVCLFFISVREALANRGHLLAQVCGRGWMALSTHRVTLHCDAAGGTDVFGWRDVLGREHVLALLSKCFVTAETWSVGGNCQVIKNKGAITERPNRHVIVYYSYSTCGQSDPLYIRVDCARYQVWTCLYVQNPKLKP